MKTKKIVSVLILTCIVALGMSSDAGAQSYGRVAGTVIDATTREPLPDAKVDVRNDDFQSRVATDLEGRYFVDELPPGRYRMAFRCSGYQTYEYSGIEVRADSTTRFNAEMRQRPRIDSGIIKYPGEVAGRVVNGRNQSPIVGAKVEVIGDNFEDSCMTDLKGSYYIVAVPAGKYKVIITFSGFKTIEIANTEIEPNLMTIIDKAMEPASAPGEVVQEEYERPSLVPVYEEVTDPEPKQISSKDLKHTVVSAHMEVPIEPGKNILYCSTFQLAWNMMQDSIIKEDILLEGDPEIARMLNKQLSRASDISEDCYVAMVGFLTQEFLDRVNRKLKEKFGDQAPPEVVEPISPTIPQFFAYAYLFKNLEFEHIFRVSTYPIVFNSGNDTTKLNAFEVNSQEQRDQVTVLDYNDDSDFIISLRSKSPDDEIILAKIPAQATLLAAIQSVQDRITQSSPSKVEDDELVKIPKCDFNVTHDYDELIGKGLLNPGWGEWFISKAVQWTRFRLNEKGIVLKSEAKLIGMGFRAQDSHRKPRQFILDRPFLICLREKDGRYPYFAMWIDNPELLLAWQE